jgi:hypothetical protein
VRGALNQGNGVYWGEQMQLLGMRPALVASLILRATKKTLTSRAQTMYVDGVYGPAMARFFTEGLALVRRRRRKQTFGCTLPTT